MKPRTCVMSKSKIKQRICILKLTMKKERINLAHASSSIHLKTKKHQHIKTNQRWFWKIQEDESKTCMLERLKHKHIGASDLPFRFTSSASDAVDTRLREPPIEREVGVFLGRWQPPMETSLFPSSPTPTDRIVAISPTRGPEMTESPSPFV